jgi:hypothetical protein
MLIRGVYQQKSRLCGVRDKKGLSTYRKMLSPGIYSPSPNCFGAVACISVLAFALKVDWALATAQSDFVEYVLAVDTAYRYRE